MTRMTTPDSGPPDLNNEPQPAPRRSGRFFACVWGASVAAALVQPAAWLLSRSSWTADLICHFREPALVATLFSLAASAKTHRRFASALAVLAFAQAWPLLAYWGPNPVPADPAAPERFRVLLANVLFDNANPAELADLIRSEAPDAVVIVEFNDDCRRALAGVAGEFPFRTELPSGASGLALWFRRAPASMDPPRQLVGGRNAVLRATFDFAGKPRRLWAVHPTSPLWRAGEPGNPEITAIAHDVASAEGSKVVVGDFNTTDASGHFRDFVSVTGLRDTRLGFGRQASWPTWSLYRISIDHAFVSDDLAVVDRRLGPVIGSDHFPVVSDLAPAAASARRSDAQASHSIGPR